ncbi:hypothetical protein AAFO92_10470 [Roseovarius sp. CAU 1744]|uniref:hypothetical protein n=1 Tax=Roseovarius sp. CAU 1744 TaxID=3140368 RepID=UPI00325A9787
MLHTIADVLNYQAVAGEDHFPVADLFVDGHGGRIRFVALDIGGWFESTHAIVADSKFGVPDTRSRLWPVEISKEDVEAQPRWNDKGWFDWLTDGRAMPLLFSGPPGMGYDPLILAQIDEQAKSLTGAARSAEARAAETKQEEGQACISGLLRGSGLLGMKVNGHGNELGHIADLLFDAARMRASHFVIDAEKFFKDSRHCIPFAQLRRVDQDANEATFDLTTESLQSAPKCADMEEIDQSAEIILPGPYYHVGL